MTLLLAFVLGTLYELSGTFWVRAASSGRAVRTGVAAACCGALALAGISLAVTSWSNAPGLVLGYGVGAYLGVRFSR